MKAAFRKYEVARQSYDTTDYEFEQIEMRRHDRIELHDLLSHAIQVYYF